MAACRGRSLGPVPFRSAAGPGLGDEARQFLAEMRQIHSMDIHMPTRQGQTVKLRVVSRPEKELAVLLSRMKLRLPNVPLKLKM